MKTTIELAREAGLIVNSPYLMPHDHALQGIKAFEALVRADEREELLQNSVQAHEVEAFRDVVTCNAIRARGSNST
jgi:hypothetical protein